MTTQSALKRRQEKIVFIKYRLFRPFPSSQQRGAQVLKIIIHCFQWSMFCWQRLPRCFINHAQPIFSWNKSIIHGIQVAITLKQEHVSFFQQNYIMACAVLRRGSQQNKQQPTIERCFIYNSIRQRKSTYIFRLTKPPLAQIIRVSFILSGRKTRSGRRYQTGVSMK